MQPILALLLVLYIPLAFAHTSQRQCHQLVDPASLSDSDRLAGESLQLLNWNIAKQSRDGWQKILAGASSADLILIQEAKLEETLYRALPGHWSFAPGYIKDKMFTGVATISRVPPISYCSIEVMEPWLKTPKAALITEFALRDSQQTLLVANIHAVNFSLGIDEFRQQIDLVSQTLAEHKGPIIFSGDFNTWNNARQQYLLSQVERLQLQAVHYDNDSRKRFITMPLDHIFTRGLTIQNSQVDATDSSDHNPMSIAFSQKAKLHSNYLAASKSR